MNEKECGLCAWYDNSLEYCTAYRESHYPSDGEGCPGWKHWDDPDLKGDENHAERL